MLTLSTTQGAAQRVPGGHGGVHPAADQDQVPPAAVPRLRPPHPLGVQGIARVQRINVPSLLTLLCHDDNIMIY